MVKISILVVLMYLSINYVVNTETKIGYINNKDKSIFIRKGKGIDFPIIDTVLAGNFFIFTKDNSTDWYTAYKLWGLEGFIHKSSAIPLNETSRIKLFKVIDSIFDIEIKLYSNSLLNKNTKEQSKFHEKQFSEILIVFITLMKDYYDEKLIQKYFDIMILEEYSADEWPRYVLGYIFIDRPYRLKKSTILYSDPRIYYAIKYGFTNIIYNNEKKFKNINVLKEELKLLFKYFKQNETKENTTPKMD